MAGSSSLFDAKNFRATIRSTMTMGLTPVVADRPTFRWTTTHTYTKQDSAAKPWDWTATAVTTDAHEDVQIPVAMEFFGRMDQVGTSVGQFDLIRVILTILDDDYELVRGADLVLLGENKYNVQFVEPPIGLFDVGVYRVHLRSIDES